MIKTGLCFKKAGLIMLKKRYNYMKMTKKLSVLS